MQAIIQCTFVKRQEIQILHLVYNFKNLNSHYLSACQLAVRPGSTSAMAPVFHATKVITIYLQDCCTKEGLSTAP